MTHHGTKPLETARLKLRRFTLDDAEAMYNNWACDSEVTRYLTWQPYAGMDAAVDFIQTFCLANYDKKDFYQWAIELKDLHQVIGSISVVDCNDKTGCLMLGWAIGQKWWGQGIMPEAAKEMVRYLFEEVGANKVGAEHDIANPKSGRVMQKIGMQYEGTLKKYHINNQGLVDTCIYGITKEEWEQKASGTDPFLDLAARRYSCRSFSNRPVEQEKVDKILRAGQLAPTACNKQPQQIYVLQSEAALFTLQKCKKSHFGETLAFLICADKSEAWTREYDQTNSAEIDGAIIATHMMLEAQNLGIGCTWVMNFIPDAVRVEFALALDMVPVCVLVMGYPASEAAPSPRHADRKALDDTCIFL